MSVQIDEFAISLSEKQFPMFIRLMELFTALYYGNLKNTPESNMAEDSTPEADRILKARDIDMYDSSEAVEGDGWISWAWNSVLGEEEDNIKTSIDIPKHKVLIAIGIHVKSIKFLLKSGHRPYNPVISAALAGTGVELLVKGEDFFSCAFGITEIRLSHWIDTNSN